MLVSYRMGLDVKVFTDYPLSPTLLGLIMWSARVAVTSPWANRSRAGWMRSFANHLSEGYVIWDDGNG